MVLSHRTEPQFSQPVRQIVMMLIVLGLTAAVAVLIFPAIAQIFLASPYLKIFIVIVFLIGVAACFWQVLRADPGGELDRGLRARPARATSSPRRRGCWRRSRRCSPGRQARRSLTSTSTRAVLETVATRIEEQRDLTRYIISLLIFLGLLGTFYGLATVVPAVVDTIRSLAPQEGQDAMAGFDNLMTGLEGQLGGMGTAFGSSLLGLSGILVVGLLELFASHAQNRFYRELEEWLRSITKHRHPRRRAGGGADRGQRADGDRPDRRADRRAARDGRGERGARAPRPTRGSGRSRSSCRSRSPSRRRRSTTRS